MAIIWTKDWTAADDGTVLKAVDLKNIQDDINTTGLADADAIQGVDVVAPTPSDDGKALTYDDGVPEFNYTSLSGLPAGIYVPYGGTTAPAGWLLCYGQAVSRTTYADLFTAIGIAYGAGDTTTTFNVPDIRGRLPLGKDDMGGTPANRVTAAAADTIGGGLGVEEHALTIAEMPAHGHDHDGIREAAGALKTGTASGSNTPFPTSSTGGGAAHTNLQPTQTGNYIIKI